METIKSYLNIIGQQLLNQISGKPGEFIRLIQQSESEPEEVFIQKLSIGKRKREYYQVLKTRTLEILQAFAIISNSNTDGEVKKKYDLCQKKFLLGQKFLGKGVRNEGIQLIKQAQKIAVEYDFVHLASELSSLLYHHHALFPGNWKIAASYATAVEKYSNYYLQEKKVEHCFYQVIGCESGALKKRGLKEIVEQLTQLKGETLKCKTYKAMSKVLYGRSIGNYQLIIESSKQALNTFEGRKGVYTSHYHFFLTNITAAQIAIGNYQEAEKNLNAARNYAYPRSSNTYIIELYQTVCKLHAGQYLKAYQLYQKNKKCKFEHIRQQFAIIEAYMCFLSRMGYLQLDKKFRIGKYLNETIKAQTQKESSNITILIAELLIYLARDRGKFIDRAEAINNYSYRHLTGEHTKRAKRFMRILCLMPRANFNPIALQRIASRQIKYLVENPISMGQDVFIEIIPFEDLLRMIMQQLERKVA